MMNVVQMIFFFTYVDVLQSWLRARSVLPGQCAFEPRKTLPFPVLLPVRLRLGFFFQCWLLTGLFLFLVVVLEFELFESHCIW